MKTGLTFRELEKTTVGTEWSSCGNSPLDKWYCGVRDVPLTELEDGDLCRACRQQLFLDFIFPIAIERLRLRPLAGDIYDGELFASLKAIPLPFWKGNRGWALEIRAVAESLSRENDDEDLARDIKEMMSRIDL